MVDVPHCPIATDAINERLAIVRADVAARRAEYTNGATILIREARGGVVTDPSAEITEEVEGVGL
jgi:23S rRNA (uracil1939-C5)-methyltransferase/tRNA (uracil-5-)-methyltransferase